MTSVLFSNLVHAMHVPDEPNPVLIIGAGVAGQMFSEGWSSFCLIRRWISFIYGRTYERYQMQRAWCPFSFGGADWKTRGCLEFRVQ